LPSLRLNRLEFASVLQYPPRLGVVLKDLLDEARTARNLVLQLKGALAGAESTRTAEVLANFVKSNAAARSLTAAYFTASTVLVPVPRSALLTSGGLWPARVLAMSLRTGGLGNSVREIIERAIPIRKSASSLASGRPCLLEKHDSLRVTGSLEVSTDITLVDDVVTTGSELLAAANRISEAFPTAQIKAFAAARTMSGPPRWSFTKVVDPVAGIIEYDGEQTRRSP
jgi:predicted amidophosphoribosyltransferase